MRARVRTCVRCPSVYALMASSRAICMMRRMILVKFSQRPALAGFVHIPQSRTRERALSISLFHPPYVPFRHIFVVLGFLSRFCLRWHSRCVLSCRGSHTASARLRPVTRLSADAIGHTSHALASVRSFIQIGCFNYRAATRSEAGARRETSKWTRGRGWSRCWNFALRFIL